MTNIPESFSSNFWTLFNNWLIGFIGFGPDAGVHCEYGLGCRVEGPSLPAALLMTILGIGVGFMILRAFREVLNVDAMHRPTSKLVMSGVDRPIWMDDNETSEWISGGGYTRLGNNKVKTSYVNESGDELEVTRYENS